MKRLKPWVFAVAVRSVVNCLELIYGLIHCSSSTMWTGPWRRAGEQHMRTVSQEELIWSVSTVRRRRSSCLCTAKPAASGSASSTIPQKEVSRMCVLKRGPCWKETPLNILNTSLFRSRRLFLERWHTSRSHQLGSRGAQQPRGARGVCRDGEQHQRDLLLVERSQLWRSSGLDMQDC